MRASAGAERGYQETKGGWAALASSRAETKVGQAALLASDTAPASSRAETKLGQADLLASKTANTDLDNMARELGQARDAAEQANPAKSRSGRDEP